MRPLMVTAARSMVPGATILRRATYSGAAMILRSYGLNLCLRFPFGADASNGVGADCLALDHQQSLTFAKFAAPRALPSITRVGSFASNHFEIASASAEVCRCLVRDFLIFE